MSEQLVSIRKITEADTAQIVEWRITPAVKTHFIDQTLLAKETIATCYPFYGAGRRQ